MPQVMIVPRVFAEEAETLEREAMQLAASPDSPGGEHTTEEEWLHIRGIRRLRLRMERYADGLETAVTMIRTGPDGHQTKRSLRALHPEYDDVA